MWLLLLLLQFDYHCSVASYCRQDAAVVGVVDVFSRSVVGMNRLPVTLAFKETCHQHGARR